MHAWWPSFLCFNNVRQVDLYIYAYIIVVFQKWKPNIDLCVLLCVHIYVYMLLLSRSTLRAGRTHKHTQTNQTSFLYFNNVSLVDLYAHTTFVVFQ